eukprot:55278-Prorocentrum_minimum.AAC.1
MTTVSSATKIEAAARVTRRRVASASMVTCLDGHAAGAAVGRVSKRGALGSSGAGEDWLATHLRGGDRAGHDRGMKRPGAVLGSRTGVRPRRQQQLREGMYRSSLDARKPPNPTNSEEYQGHLQ